MKRQESLKIFVLAPMFAALTAAGAFIKLPLPWVPLTLQTLLVFLSGLILGSRGGALSQILYISIGLVGLPIFAGGGGPAYVLSPTFGYLVAFIPAAFVIGLFSERDGFVWSGVGVLIGLIIVYIVGIPYLYFSVNYILGKEMTILNALKLGFFVPIWGDLIKSGVALGIFYSAKSVLSLPVSKR